MYLRKEMGLIFNSAAVISSSITVAALYFGIGPFWAFMLGAFILYAPIKFLLPLGRSRKPISETGIISSLFVIASFAFWGYGPAHSFLIGLTSGYMYLYWWLFIFPRFIIHKNLLKNN